MSETQWQPIETAPDDGMEAWVLVWDGQQVQTAAIWWHEEEKPVWFNGDRVVRATHWQPLPIPPHTNPDRGTP